MKARSQERRRGAESSATRTALIEAAEQLMCEQGYAAVTVRQLADRAGLKPQLVHYYFRTMDDLLVAVIRRGGDRVLEKLASALAAQQPLRAIWNFGNDSRTARLSMEFLALANHRKAVQAEVKRYAEQVRRVQAAALTRQFEMDGIAGGVPPMAALVLTTAAAYLLFMESTLGISLGHGETQSFIQQHLRRLESSARAVRPATVAKAGQRSTAVRSARRPRSKTQQRRG
jgi:AcrR family transcriptional regulator